MGKYKIKVFQWCRWIDTISDSTDEWCDKFQIHSITNLNREFHELLSNCIMNDKSLIHITT